MRGVQTNFTAGSLGGASTSKSRRVAASVKDGSGRTAPRLDAPVSTAETVDTTTSVVPAGTTVEVERWVGSDPVRAQRALDAEYASAAPRKTLVSKLNRLGAVPTLVSQPTPAPAPAPAPAPFTASTPAPPPPPPPLQWAPQ